MNGYSLASDHQDVIESVIVIITQLIFVNGSGIR